MEDRPCPVTGTGVPSGLVAMPPSSGEHPNRAAYVLEGIAPDATVGQVRAMVSPLVQRLHEIRQLRRHSGAASGLKAFKIEVDSADHPWIMNPANCPAGLRVRPWTVKQAQERFQPSAVQHEQHMSSRGGGNFGQNFVEGNMPSGAWYHRRTYQ